MPSGGREGCNCPKPYPQEFRGDVARVARDRGDDVTIERVANDFGVRPTMLAQVDATC
ncbi:hypothetical protein GOAMI_90_00010 [Gordonia amicalis NBRC 100051 = JCM 11271]|nr:hypothetical protein GOAMI_90_00010 [Gordonia amicalis NBRC 100051 = JCM 11271]